MWILLVAQDGVDVTGGAFDGQALDFLLEVVFLAAGHAAGHRRAVAFGKTAGLVGDFLSDRIDVHLERLDAFLAEVALFGRIVARLVDLKDAEAAKIGGDDELAGGHGPGRLGAREDRMNPDAGQHRSALESTCRACVDRATEDRAWHSCRGGASIALPIGCGIPLR